MKKFFVVCMMTLLVLAMTACGNNGGAEKAPEPDNTAKTVTAEQYNALGEANWGDMDQAEMEEFLGVKGVVDEERTEDWGEGYLVVDFPGPDEASYVHVLFSQDDDGQWSASSISAVGELANGD